MDLISSISIILGVISVYISIKARAEAQQINHQTEIQLVEIKNILNIIYRISDKMDQNTIRQMNKIVNSISVNQRELIKKEIIHELSPLFYQKPELLKKILK